MTDEQIRATTPAGWTYTGRDGKFYLFQTGNYSVGFKEMQCLAEDLTEKNLALMTKKNLTR